MDQNENNQTSQEPDTVSGVTKSREPDTVSRVTKNPKKVEAGKKGALVKKLRNANSKSQFANSTAAYANSKSQSANSTTESANSTAECANSKSQFAKSILFLSIGIGVGILCGRFVFFKNTDDVQLKKYTNSHYMR